MTSQRTVYLIDGTAYIHRAFHAIRDLSNSKGMPTNAVFGYSRMLLALVEQKKPDLIGVCFDSKGPTFRHDAYPEYKANRPPMPEEMAQQIPWIKQVTEGFRIPIIELPGYEADDLIGTLSAQAQAQGFKVVMVTGDKDFVQLVTPAAVIWDPMKETTIDTDVVKNTYGLTPAQMVDVQGLSGDTTDNIPGVPGIGPKTAVDLIVAFGSMDGVYAHLESIKKPKQKENLSRFRDQAFLSRRLVTIATDAPVRFDPEAFERSAPDSQTLCDLFQQLEFRQLQSAFSPTAPSVEKRYAAVTTLTQLDALVATLTSADIIAVDTETTSQHPMLARLVGISLSTETDAALYIPCGHTQDAAPAQLPLETVIARLKPVLENPRIAKVGQNIKYDWIVLMNHGIALDGVVFDTMLASYLLNPSKRAHNLDQIALDFLGHRTIRFEEVAGKGKDAVTFDRVPLAAAMPYACEDADITLSAYRVLLPMLAEHGLDELMTTIEVPLVPVLARMERAGVRVDRARLKQLSEVFASQLDKIETEIHHLAGEDFNINSSQQLGRILFEVLGLPMVKKTKKKTAYSTDVEVLTVLAERHDLPAMVLRHRTLSKLKSTYTDALQELIHPETGRIHTSFNQTVAATGRLSSSDPNLQNIPIRTEEGRMIREAFIPREGWTLVSADYSQIELRLMAHCSEDPILIRSFQEGEDVHERTAMEVFQLLPGMVTDDLRRQAKVINFGIIYGMSPFGLSKALGISQKMARTYIDHYFNRYAGVKRYIDETIAEGRKTGQTTTLLGRIRLLPDIAAANRSVREFAERTAVNTPIQGTAADLIKLAMIRVDTAFREAGMASAMLLSVHDEIVFESPPEEVDAAMDRVRRIMESVWALRVPLSVNIGRGDNWADIH
ncbi:MAG: DNA polymerase I [Pseudomonadota bacterium]